MKKFLKDLIKPFLSTYEVVFTMYHIIPGRPVEKNEQQFKFEKGEREEAEAYFQKVVAQTSEMRLVPSEIQLKKGRRTIARKTFGPVDDVNSYLNVKAS